MAERDDLWGPIDAKRWRDTPCIVGRVATEDDVRAGFAVFYVEGVSNPATFTLPRCGLLKNNEGSALLVVVIQAESRYDGQVLFGYRPFNGGNGICMNYDVQFVDGPEGLLC